MGRIEKTVFISYRRTNVPWALAIYQNLTTNGYDVFFDYQSIDSGNFEKVILENIKSRAHFLVILTPSALERCKEPGDWFRREIETAMDEKRNIVPLMLESFDFGSPLVKEALTGKLAALSTYNGLRVYSEYFFEAMDKLRERYMNAEVRETAALFLNAEATKITETQKTAANDAAPVEKAELIAQEWFERGYVYAVEAKNFNEAIRWFSESIHLNPRNAIAYYNRGNARRDNSDLNGAIEDYAEAIRLKPDFAEAYINRGNARSDNNDLQGALADYDEAIRLKPDDAIAYNNRGTVRNANNDLQSALADYDEAIRIQPDYASAYSNRGVARKASNDLQGALTDYDKAIRLKPDFADAYFNRGNAREDNGDSNGALEDYTEAIRLKPDFANAYLNRGTVRNANNDLQGALVDYDKVIHLQPNNADYYSVRGNIYRDLGDLDRAIMDYTEAIRIKSDNANYLLSRGNLLSAKGDHLNALPDFEKASKLNPESGSARASLTRVLKSLGRAIEAERVEQAAREIIKKEDEYNQACFEAICGNTEKALELLKIGLEKKQSTKEWARLDPDFETIRNDPRFKELVGE